MKAQLSQGNRAELMIFVGMAMWVVSCDAIRDEAASCGDDAYRDGVECVELASNVDLDVGGEDASPADASAMDAATMDTTAAVDDVREDGGAEGDSDVISDDARGDTSVAEDASNPSEIALPFWLGDESVGFVPSGFMGDVNGISMDNQCGERQPDVSGPCHRVAWAPSAGSPGWAGVWWQYPADNWGAQPGRDIAAGATRVSFLAWGAEGGEVVSFEAGYAGEDGFNTSTGDLTLGANPERYEIDLSGQAYSNVAGAFSWVSGQAGGVEFYVDDIHWE